MLAPMIETLVEAKRVKFPEGFTARSQLTPDWEEVKKEVEKELEKMEERVLAKSDCRNDGDKKGIRKLGSSLEWHILAREHWSIDSGGGEGVRKSEIEAIQKELRECGMVVSPIDKNPSEMAVI